MKNPRKILINWHVFFARLKTRWSFVVWLLAALLAVIVYFHGGRFGGMRGSVFTRIQTTAPLETGRLVALHVEVGDVVRPGDLLAQMDTSVLEAETALMAAEMRNTIAEIQTEEIQNLRRFDAAIIRLESELRELRLKQAEASLETITKTYPDVITQVKKSLAEARSQKASISEQSRSAIALVEQAAVEQARLFSMQVEACSLRAQQDCTVSRLYFFPGDIVSAGDPVVSSVVAGDPRIIGFLSEYNARDVEVEMKAYLTSVSGYGPVVKARVLAMTPEIYSLPNRAGPISGQTSRGRRVVLAAEPGCSLLPGESVNIHFSRPWTTRLMWSLFGGKSEGEQ